MTPQVLLLLALLVGMTAVIARDRVGPDLAMFGTLALAVGMGIVDIRDAGIGFADPAVMTVGALFVVAAAIRETGALQLITRAVFGDTRSPRVGLVRLVLPTAFFSAFVNNTPIVAMFIPATRSFARRVKQSPSRFLMPLGFAAMLGGTCTLIGTSANLVVSGRLEQAGLEPLGMLELAWVGVPTVILGLGYLTTLGWRLLDQRKAPGDIGDKEAREYLVEMRVAKGSPLVGKSVADGGLRHLPGLFLAEIRREDGSVLRPVAPHDLIEVEDHLVLSGLAETVADLRALPGLHPVEDVDVQGLETHLYEVVMSHRSRLIGRTVRESGFRRRFDAAILAIHRAGERIESRIGDITLRPGDTLLLSASPGFWSTWRDSPDFYMVGALDQQPPPKHKNRRAALVVLSLLVAIPVGSTVLHSFSPGVPEVSIAVVALLAVVALVALGCINARQARSSVDFGVLIVIGSALGLAQALTDSGAAEVLAGGLLGVTGSLPPVALLAVVYLLTVCAAAMLSNAAGAALVFPIALSLAQAAGLDVRPFAIVVALAASAGFFSPVGSNASLLIYGPGGYRFSDFVRVGLPLNVICLAVALTIVPLVWPL